MYAYFGTNGNLLEIALQGTATAGSSEYNKIYAYWANDGWTDDSSEYSCTITFYDADGNVLGTSDYAMSIVAEELPDEEGVDYTHFEEDTDYKFAYIAVPSAVTSQSGWIRAVIRVFDGNDQIKALQDITFQVNGSYVYDEDLSVSQYDYLLSLVTSINTTDWATLSADQTFSGDNTFSGAAIFNGDTIVHGYLTCDGGSVFSSVSATQLVAGSLVVSGTYLNWNYYSITWNSGTYTRPDKTSGRISTDDKVQEMIDSSIESAAKAYKRTITLSVLSSEFTMAMITLGDDEISSIAELSDAIFNDTQSALSITVAGDDCMRHTQGQDHSGYELVLIDAKGNEALCFSDASGSGTTCVNGNGMAVSFVSETITAI